VLYTIFLIRCWLFLKSENCSYMLKQQYIFLLLCFKMWLQLSNPRRANIILKDLFYYYQYTYVSIIINFIDYSEQTIYRNISHSSGKAMSFSIIMTFNHITLLPWESSKTVSIFFYPNFFYNNGNNNANVLYKLHST